MKIKNIDMLVKIANREENTNVKTKYDSVDWDKNDFLLSVYNEFGKRNNDKIVEFLNDEVEIIEEPKKIEKIEMYQDEEGHYFLNKQYRKVYVNCDEMDFMVDKFNELIDEINNLKEND